MLPHLLLAFCLAGAPELLVFDAPGFPIISVDGPLPHIADAEVAGDVDSLRRGLDRDPVLVWRHGAAFPAAAWPDFVAFLERGGSFLHLGGEPFTHPVLETPKGYVTQPRTNALLKELRLNQAYRIDVDGATRRYRGELAPLTPDDRILPEGAVAWALEPRLSDTKDFASEDGAPGSREGIVRPLAMLHFDDDDPRFPCAAAAFAVDRLFGRFAGGRWVLHLLSSRPADDALERLLAEATRPATDLRVDPRYGCFHAGERTEVRLSAHRPGADDTVAWRVDLRVHGPDGLLAGASVPLRVSERGTAQVPLFDDPPPGLYRVTARVAGMAPVETGFWVFDDALFRSGGPITFNDHCMLRDGEPMPVIGTTVMSHTVHRKFLFEPNAAVWDDTFAEMAAVGINLTRTGVWSAYRKVALDPGVVDESWLRALEGYYLSARRHDIPVIFTLFAFAPEDYGFDNPYLDPRAVAAQRAYVSAVAERFKDAPEFLIDLINEPSFSSPDKLWQCRPNGDRYERAEFLSWLKERFSDYPDGRTWQDVVRARWRLSPEAAIDLPSDDDFADQQVFGDRHPYRAQDYVHFAQYGFRDWMEEMIDAVRDVGSRAPITVGQDEGGLLERPSPLFHDDLVDFTSMHTWWWNDALLADAMLAKAPGKPLLVSETGVMQRELLSGESIRSPQESARLLERKLATALFGGAFGVVEWCYDVNPYMASDNEVAIGLRRVDGSYKPEHEVMRRFAAFVARNPAVFATRPTPTTAVVLPVTEHWGPRSTKLAGARRIIRALRERAPDVQVVLEHRTGVHLGTPTRVLLPSCSGISDAAWRDVERVVDGGATLFCSGWFETDDAGLPAHRIGATARPLRVEEGGLRFSLDLAQSWFAAAAPITRERVRHDPLPRTVDLTGAADPWAVTTPYREGSLRYRELEDGGAALEVHRDGEVVDSTREPARPR